MADETTQFILGDAAVDAATTKRKRRFFKRKKTTPPLIKCENCEKQLVGEYCANCGLHEIDCRRWVLRLVLDAALTVIRSHGYASTSVDELCTAAGVTKGAFFHHFRSKEDLAVAAAGHFSDGAAQLFGTAPFRDLTDPADRVLGYVEFRKTILQGGLALYAALTHLTAVQRLNRAVVLLRDADAKQR